MFSFKRKLGQRTGEPRGIPLSDDLLHDLAMGRIKAAPTAPGGPAFFRNRMGLLDTIRWSASQKTRAVGILDGLISMGYMTHDPGDATRKFARPTKGFREMIVNQRLLLSPAANQIIDFGEEQPFPQSQETATISAPAESRTQGDASRVV